MKKFILLTGIALFLSIFSMMTAHARCSGASGFLSSITAGGIAQKEVLSDSIIIYDWNQGWYSLSYDQQYQFIDGIAGAEVCARGGTPTVVITFHGEDVAKADSLRGVRVLKSKP